MKVQRLISNGVLMGVLARTERVNSLTYTHYEMLHAIYNLRMTRKTYDVGSVIICWINAITTVWEMRNTDNAPTDCNAFGFGICWSTPFTCWLSSRSAAEHDNVGQLCITPTWNFIWNKVTLPVWSRNFTQQLLSKLWIFCSVSSKQSTHQGCSALWIIWFIRTGNMFDVSHILDDQNCLPFSFYYYCLFCLTNNNIIYTPVIVQTLGLPAEVGWGCTLTGAKPIKWTLL